MTSKGVDQWVTSPYCFCKELPWLVLSGLPSSPALYGGLGWGDWAILAACLIALALFLLLLSLLLCCLCPPGFCCCGRRGCSACCAGSAAGGGKKKKGLIGGHSMEMSSIGGSEESNLTAVDLKLPRAWMDPSKGDLTDDRGDLGLGGGGGRGGEGAFFGSQKTWTSANEGGYVNRAGNLGVHLRRSDQHGRQGPYDVDSVDAAHGEEDSSARGDFYRNQTTVTVIAPNIGEHIREAVQEWQKKSGLVSQRLEETRHVLNEGAVQDSGKDNDKDSRKDVTKDRHCCCQHHHCTHHSEACRSSAQEAAFGFSTVKETTQHQSQLEEDRKSSSMALVKSSASTSGMDSALTTSGESGGNPFVQCYTVTKKTTTTTYGDEEGDEETSVVTTTEKKWREGMNEVGEISVAAAASAGELLPSIGAPAQVLNDVSNVRTVRSLTNVEGGVSNVVRHYEFQQTVKDTETLL